MAYSKFSLFDNRKDSDSIKGEIKLYNALNTITDSIKEARSLSAKELIKVKNSLKKLPNYSEISKELDFLTTPENHQAMLQENKNQWIQLMDNNEEVFHFVKPSAEAKHLPPPVKQINEISEINDITSGHYRKQLYEFTYHLINQHYNIFNQSDEYTSEWKRLDHKIYPLVNRPGFRCTASIADPLTNPVEIQINFFGTIDFASKHADIDNGGPGQETLKKYEKELLLKINDLINNLDTQGMPIRLKLSGHSLGGALAKGFTHTIQRACAVQTQTPEEIMAKIDAHPETKELDINRKRLTDKLSKDRSQFANLEGLNKITGVTLYALGAPGVSKETDQDATALSYCQDSNFLRVYNHYHEKDLIRKFGKSEFLSGSYGKPNVKVHKSLVYNREISQEKIDAAKALPFPNAGKTVMALHNLTVSLGTNHKIMNTLDDTEEKFVFPLYLWVLYKVVFFIAAQLAKLTEAGGKLYSYPECEVVSPGLQFGN